MQDGDFTPAERNRYVHVASCEIDPPIANYVTVDDVWILGAATYFVSQSVTAQLRIMRPNGEVKSVQLQLKVTANSSITTMVQNELEGYLLSAAITPVASQSPADFTYVWLGIQRNGSGRSNFYRQLIGDYVNSNFGPSWPDREARRPTDLAGALIEQTVANPAAGADWSFAMLGVTRATFCTVFAQLVTSANVATRTAALQITDGANVLAIVDSTTTQVASLTTQYTGYCSSPLGGTGGTHAYWPLPAPLILRPGWTIGSLTNNIQAGDQWSLIRLVFLGQAEAL
jgi:hypothetical protein